MAADIPADSANAFYKADSLSTRRWVWGLIGISALALTLDNIVWIEIPDPFMNNPWLRIVSLTVNYGFFAFVLGWAVFGEGSLLERYGIALAAVFGLPLLFQYGTTAPINKMDIVSYAALAVGPLWCVRLCGYGLRQEDQPYFQATRWQFTVRQILEITTLVAIALACSRNHDWDFNLQSLFFEFGFPLFMAWASWFTYLVCRRFRKTAVMLLAAATLLALIYSIGWGTLFNNFMIGLEVFILALFFNFVMAGSLYLHFAAIHWLGYRAFRRGEKLRSRPVEQRRTS